MKIKCILCGNEVFKTGCIGGVVGFYNDVNKKPWYQYQKLPGAKVIYAQECSKCGYLILSTKRHE